jgi:hypothetical protein
MYVRLVKSNSNRQTSHYLDASTHSWAASIPNNFSLKMANLLPPTGQNANSLGPGHRTIAVLYSDQTLDPCQATYADILACFDPFQNIAITHVLLQEQAIGAGVVPQAYLCSAM